MNSSLIYLLQVSLVFGSCYLLYKWWFSKFTFHAFNRSFLLFILPFSLLLPFSAKLFPKIQNFSTQLPFIEEITMFSGLEYFADETTIAAHQTINYSFWILVAYAIGALCYFIRFVRTTYAVFKLKRNAHPVKFNTQTLYKSDISEVFSYFHWIFVPKTETINELIITHEKAHVKQLHSVDVMLTELYIVFFWFHPLAYWYRKSLKSIHEFQADAFVLKQYAKKSTYLELLLMSLQPKNNNPIVNYFSQSTLKKRIEMMTKSPSKNRSKFLYFLLIPVIAFAFMAFTNSNEVILSDTFVPTKIETSGTPTLFPVQNGNEKNISSFFGVNRNHPKLKNSEPHGGIDIKATRGTPVVATADGLVLKAEEEGEWGNLIVISHADGFETWYAHLHGFKIKDGSVVKKGTIIGYVGTTGLSTGSHLHYEVRKNGKRLNPMNYIAE